MALRVFKNLPFHRWARKVGLTNAVLAKAAKEVEAGLVDGRLGGFLVKKRLGRPGAGKRGGYRTILAHRQGSRLFFLEGYAKNEKDDLDAKEQGALMAAGEVYMKLTDAELEMAVTARKLLEVIVT